MTRVPVVTQEGRDSVRATLLEAVSRSSGQDKQREGTTTGREAVYGLWLISFLGITLPEVGSRSSQRTARTQPGHMTPPNRL